MKAGKPHRVPLSDAAVEILEKMRGVQQGDFVFPGMKSGRPLSNMALLTLLDRMDYAGITSHRFRSTFRDWAGEHANIPREVAETALAHVIKDKSDFPRISTGNSRDTFLVRAQARECGFHDLRRPIVRVRNRCP